MPDINETNIAVLAHTPNSATVATLTMVIEQPQFKLFDSVVILCGKSHGKPGIVTGACLVVEPTCCYWSFYLRGKGVDSSGGWADFELKRIELGTVRKPRIKRPEFKLFDPVRLYTGETGFISGIDMADSGKNAHWQYSVFGVGINQGDFFCFEEFQQFKSVQAA